MDGAFRDEFLRLWAKYFGEAPLPICFYYTDDEASREFIRPVKGHACAVGQLTLVCRGETLAFDGESVPCAGGKMYMGFSTELAPDFEYFLSCGIPGKLEGERYKKSPEIVREIMKALPESEAPARYIVFKRWDRLEESDRPEVVIFLNTADVISGLYTLAGFDEVEVNAVVAPFGAGCATIVQYPYLEKDKAAPRCVMGMFDVSARPCVGPAVFSFAAPFAKFERMVRNMEESFLITDSWARVRRRIGKTTRDL